MQDRYDAGKKGFKMQGVGGRTGGMQDKKDAGQEGCRKGGAQERKAEGKRAEKKVG